MENGSYARHGLIPDSQKTVPRACGHSHAVISYTQAADTVVMTSKNTCPVSLQRVPHVTVEVVITSQEQAPTFGEGHGRDAADDVVMGIHQQLLVGPQVKEAASGIVGASGESTAVWEKADGVDVRHVARERLPAQAVADVPQLGRGVARARNEGPHVRAQRQAHDVARVAGECGRLLGGLDVPQRTSRIS